MKIKKLIPEVRKAKVLDGKVEIWFRGNCRSYCKPKLFRIGFSGSNADPYSTLHIYIWKIDFVWWLNNPLKPIMDLWQGLKINLENFKTGNRCPECNSVRLRSGNGLAYEPIVHCKACGSIVWEPDDITPYIE